MNRVRVGVVGVGHLGRFHAVNYNQIPEAELVGVFDTDRKRAEEVASETQTKAYDDLESLLAEVDGVSIAVPTDHHHDVGKRALRGGIHCLMEKPIAQTVGEAEALLRLAGEKDLIFQVGHVERFNPAFRTLEHFEFHPGFIESHRLAPFNPRGTEVSVVLDLMIHDIDVVMHMVKSPIESIDASGVAVASETVDIANARLRFENGCVANLTASRISTKKMRRMRVFQKDAYVTVDFLDRVAEVYRLGDEAGEAATALGEMGVGENKKLILCGRPAVPETWGLQKELEAFVRTVAGERIPSVSGEEAKAALSVAMKILDKLHGEKD